MSNELITNLYNNLKEYNNSVLKSYTEGEDYPANPKIPEDILNTEKANNAAGEIINKISAGFGGGIPGCQLGFQASEFIIGFNRDFKAINENVIEKYLCQANYVDSLVNGGILMSKINNVGKIL